MACRATGGLVSDERVDLAAYEASDGSPALAGRSWSQGVWERGGRVGAAWAELAVPWARLQLISAPTRSVARVRGRSPQGCAGGARGARSRDSTPRRRAPRRTRPPPPVLPTGRKAAGSSRVGLSSSSSFHSWRRRGEPPLHRAAAELLESGPEDDADPSLIATLWLGAGEIDLAIAATLQQRRGAGARERSRGSRVALRGCAAAAGAWPDRPPAASPQAGRRR